METINFCELSDNKLMKLIDFLGEKEITEKSTMKQTFIDNKCVEKKWEWYGELTICPQKITATGQVTVILMTSEKFLKMREIFI